MAEMFKVLVAAIVMMAFYSMAINAIVYTLPDPAIYYTDAFSKLENSYDLNDISNVAKDNIERQTNIPVIEIGALVFYSGNIVIDLLMNFAFAIPQMIGLIFQAFEMLFGFDSQISALVTGFMSILVSVLYLIGIIQFILEARTGNKVL